MDCRVADSTVGIGGAKTAVPGDCVCVAAEAQVRCALVCEKMAVGCAVHFMTGRASFHTGRFMFEEKGSALVRVALQAGHVFETSKSFSCRGFMGIVTGCAPEYSLLEPVPFVQLKLRIDILMACEAAFCGACIQERGFRISMNGVARGAVHGCFSVRTAEKPGVILGVACDAFLRFFIGQIFSFKSKNIGTAAFIHVCLSVAVAAGAAL